MIVNKRLLYKTIGLLTFLLIIPMFFNLTFSGLVISNENIESDFEIHSGSNEPWGTRITIPNDPRDSATIIWFTDSLPIDHVVKYGISSGSFTKEITANYELQLDKYILDAALVDLDADTRYFYTIGSDTDGWAQESNFTTAPEPKTRGIHFAAFGDSRSNRDARRMVVDLIMQNSSQLFGSQPEFILHVGDIVSSGDELDQWQDYFNDSENLFANVPVYPTPGNHDLGGVTQKWYREQFVLPQNAGPEWYYSFNWGPVHVFSLDSENHGVPPYDTLNNDWLESDLKKSESDSNILWDVALFHQPFFTSGGHDERLDLRESWGVKFDTYNVDIVFTGHNHNYERIYPISSSTLEFDDSESENYVNPEYPLYITTGCAGQGNSGAGLPSEDKAYSYLFNTTWHYCDINVTIDLENMKTTMEVYTIANTNATDINYSLVLDYFTITKDIPDSYLDAVEHIDYNYSKSISETQWIIYTALIIVGIVFVDVIILRKRAKSIKISRK